MKTISEIDNFNEQIIDDIINIICKYEYHKLNSETLHNVITNIEIYLGSLTIIDGYSVRLFTEVDIENINKSSMRYLIQLNGYFKDDLKYQNYAEVY